VAAAEGEAAVTTSRVAAECGVAVGTTYRYFSDRDALLLAAYDATVDRIVAACSRTIAALDPATNAPEAARLVLAAYLEAAEAIPAHAPLLRAMRRIRSVEQDDGDNRGRIAGDLLSPFLERFSGVPGEPDPVALSVTTTLLSALVDLYLIAEGADARARLRAELEAHMLLALERLVAAG
jgi:AcrR family transcriptional regulator